MGPFNLQSSKWKVVIFLSFSISPDDPEFADQPSHVRSALISTTIHLIFVRGVDLEEIQLLWMMLETWWDSILKILKTLFRSLRRSSRTNHLRNTSPHLTGNWLDFWHLYPLPSPSPLPPLGASKNSSFRSTSQAEQKSIICHVHKRAKLNLSLVVALLG